MSLGLVQGWGQRSISRMMLMLKFLVKVNYAPRRISSEQIVAGSSVYPSDSCLSEFSATTCWISMKLHGSFEYQGLMPISPACLVQ